MKALGIMGSPRINGNTDLLLDQTLAGLQSKGVVTEKIIVDKLDLMPCREYYACFNDGNCSIRDDMDAIYAKLLDADIVIIASPIFFYALTAQVKALIDRCQALWARRYVLKQNPPNTGRKGVFIGVGATRGQNLFLGSKMTLKYFFGALGVSYADELLVRGVDKKGEIKEHPDLLAAAYDLGQRLAGP